jgi:ABC-type antimicrobial peptide transport system permease subunit
MKLSSAASLLLGLLFSIIIVLFVVVSILLIYSLLMISVETKTFETGVLRLLGLTKYDCIQMILIQSFFYVIPAIILAYLASIPSLYGIFAAMFAKQPEIEVAPIPSAGATVKAVILGLTIPVISAIVPIYKALQK